MPQQTPQGAISPPSLQRSVGALTAASVVVANCIGVGIFTTPGFLARDLGSPFAILAIWVLGALLALAGALCYSELGAAFPRAGGEYVYLREAYGPLWGYLTGWTSCLIAFPAPIAAAAIAVSAYLSHFAPLLSPEYILWSLQLGSLQIQLSGAQVLALVIVWSLAWIHISGLQRGSRLQIGLTIIKVAAIVAVIVLGVMVGTGDWGHLQSGPEGLVPEGALSNGAVSLIFVLYSFSGWNAAAYIAGEMRQPHRSIPISLLAGTCVVALLYLGLNVVFLYGLGISEMSGVLEVGEKASLALFGPVATHLVAAFMAISILASASAMILVAPRVYYAMASDKLFPLRLAGVHPRFQTPAASILVLALWTSVLVLSGTFEQLIVYAGFALVFFSALAVGAVIVLRVRRPELVRPFRVPFYPFTPLLFLAFSAWILIFTIQGRPTESLLGIATVLLGLPLYFYWRRRGLSRN